ncbi:MAG: hypothetical protein ACXV3F_05685 [Frankiaceae bacterium]
MQSALGRAAPRPGDPAPDARLVSTASGPADLGLDGARGDLIEAARALWPGAEVRVDTKRRWRQGARSAQAAESAYLVAPSLTRPRTLLPLAAPKAAAAAVRRTDESQTLAARVQRHLFAAALATCVAPRALRGRLVINPVSGAETIETFLSSVLDRDVVVTVSVGTLRANRKYVLQVLTPDARTLAFAKLARNVLTDRLVRAEGRALQALAPRLAAPAAGGRVTVPEVLFAGTWGGRALLVGSPLLPSRGRRPFNPPTQAMAQVARAFGTRTTHLAAGSYFTRLRSAAATLPVESDRVGRLLDKVQAELGDQQVEFGCWHGDWTPWNTALCTAGVAHVWDWERFECDVPLGLDLVHYLVQGALSDPLGWAAAIRAALARFPALLPRLGVRPEMAKTLMIVYLTALSLRYLDESDTDSGVRLHAIGKCVLDELEGLLREGSTWPAETVGEVPGRRR